MLGAFGLAVLAQIVGARRPDAPFLRAFYVHLRNGFYANALFDRLVGAQRLPTRR